jgi:hypothetical protein
MCNWGWDPQLLQQISGIQIYFQVLLTLFCDHLTPITASSQRQVVATTTFFTLFCHFIDSGKRSAAPPGVYKLRYCSMYFKLQSPQNLVITLTDPASFAH